MFGIDIEQVAKNEVAKVEAKLKAIDTDHNGLSDLAEAGALLQEGAALVKPLLAEITPAELAAALNLLFPGKFTADKVQKLETGTLKMYQGGVHLVGVAKAAGVAL